MSTSNEVNRQRNAKRIADENAKFGARLMGTNSGGIMGQGSSVKLPSSNALNRMRTTERINKENRKMHLRMNQVGGLTGSSGKRGMGRGNSRNGSRLEFDESGAIDIEALAAADPALLERLIHSDPALMEKFMAGSDAEVEESQKWSTGNWS